MIPTRLHFVIVSLSLKEEKEKKSYGIFLAESFGCYFLYIYGILLLLSFLFYFTSWEGLWGKKPFPFREINKLLGREKIWKRNIKKDA